MPSDHELLNLDVEIYGASLRMIALPICSYSSYSRGSWIARHGDQPTWQDESFSALPGSARAARSGYCITMTGLTLIIVPTVLV